MTAGRSDDILRQGFGEGPLAFDDAMLADDPPPARRSWAAWMFPWLAAAPADVTVDAVAARMAEGAKRRQNAILQGADVHGVGVQSVDPEQADRQGEDGADARKAG